MSFIDDPLFFEEESKSPLLTYHGDVGTPVLFYVQSHVKYSLVKSLTINRHPKLHFPSIELIKQLLNDDKAEYDFELHNHLNSNKGNLYSSKPFISTNDKSYGNGSESSSGSGFYNSLNSFKKDILDICNSMLDYLSLNTSSATPADSAPPVLDESIFKFAAKFPNEEVLRIFKLDGERTFITPMRQEVLINTLKILYYMIGDYHQGEGLVAAFLLLFMNPPEVVKFIWVLHCFYLNGYFSASPTSYIRDSIVFIELLKERDPEYGKFLENQITPQAYASKWFIGLTIYVNPYPRNSEFILRLIESGQTYLFSYALTLALHYKKEIMECNDVSKTLEFLRLENAPETSVFKIFRASTEFPIGIEEVNKLRVRANKILKEQAEERAKREAAMAYSDDEITFSDEN